MVKTTSLNVNNLAGDFKSSQNLSDIFIYAMRSSYLTAVVYVYAMGVRA